MKVCSPEESAFLTIPGIYEYVVHLQTLVSKVYVDHVRDFENVGAEILIKWYVHISIQKFN